MTEPHFTLVDVRNRWSDVVRAAAASNGPVTIHRSQPGRPTEPTLIPALAALSPKVYDAYWTVYDAYWTALGQTPPPVVALKPLGSSSRDVDWEPATGARRVSMDVRRARSRWASVNDRVRNDGLHVIVINQYPAPGRPVIVFAPLAFVDQVRKLTTTSGDQNATQSGDSPAQGA